MAKSNPVVHFEMAGEDMGRMKKFYENVFGWTTKQFGPDMGNYVLAQTDETDGEGMLKETNRINGGFYKKTEAGSAPHVVIAVDDLSLHMEKVKSGGGEVLGDPMDIPGIGKFIMIKDTEENRVGMLEPIQMG